MRWTSLLILSTTSGGVPAGANKPCQAVASKPAMVSAMVGTSGSSASRSGVHTARILTLPSR